MYHLLLVTGLLKAPGVVYMYISIACNPGASECTQVQDPHKLVEVGWVVSRTEANFDPGFSC